MKTRNVMIVLVCIAIVSISLVFILSYKQIDVIKEFDMYLTVSDSIVGFNVDNNAIYFGTVPRGGHSNRKINVGGTMSYNINMQTFGELSKWVYVSENNFITQENEIKAITISVFVPVDAEIGNYTGKLRIIYRKK